MKYFISIDAGGTCALASAYDEKGNKLSSLQVPCANLTVDFDGGSRAILSAAEELIKETGGTPIALCAGCSGIESGDRKVKLRSFLEKELKIPVHVVNDAELALFASHGKGDGILIISGTGSIGYSRKDGNIRRVGGWGHLIGDGGSGFRIAMDAIRSITDSYDREEPQIALEKEIFSQLGISKLSELISFVYGAAKREISALVPCVVKCAEKGDEMAKEILVRAGEQLAEMALLLYRSGTPIAVSGSILKNIVLVRESFERCILAADESAKIFDAPEDVTQGGYVILGSA